MSDSQKTKILAASLIFGVALLGVGLWGTITFAIGTPIGDPGTKLNLESMLYHVQPDGTHSYLGGYLGVYSIGINWCQTMQVGATGHFTCGTSDQRQRSAYGILYDTYYQNSDNGASVSEIHAIIPIMKEVEGDYQIDHWLQAKLYGASGLNGHLWEHTNETPNLVKPGGMQPPNTIPSTLQVGVESVLYGDSQFFSLFCCHAP